jgi:hypothetical protein
MEKVKSDRSATEPETANPRDSEEALGGQDMGEQPRPALSLVSDSSGENGFFAKGAAEDKAALEMYAAMLPRGHILGRIKPRYLMMAGGVGLLLLGVAVGRHLPASNTVSTPAESSPSLAPAPAAPAPSVPAIPAPAPVAAPLPVAAPVPVAVAQEPQTVAEPAPEPEQAAPPAVAAEAQDVEGCRQAIKRRDAKLVNASCEAALAADPSLAKPLLSFAKAQFDKGRSAQAAVWARKIVQVNGSLADAYLIMGAAEQEARHPAAAKTAYQRYLELAPKGPYADDVRSSLTSL